MKFADFHVGQKIEAGPVTVHEADILGFAAQHDPQWFHTDPEAARHGRFGGLIASGWHTCGIAMRLVVDTVLAGSESFASPGIERLHWRNPVRPGDSLWLHAEILQTRISERRSDLGILGWRWRLLNQHGDEVLDLVATSLFDLQASSR